MSLFTTATGLAGAGWFTTFLHNGFQRFVFAHAFFVVVVVVSFFSTPTNTTAFQHVEAKMKYKGRGNYFDGVIVELKQKNKRAKILWDTDLSFSSLPCRNLRHHDNSRVTPEMVRIHTRKIFRYNTNSLNCVQRSWVGKMVQAPVHPLGKAEEFLNEAKVVDVKYSLGGIFLHDVLPYPYPLSIFVCANSFQQPRVWASLH